MRALAVLACCSLLAACQCAGLPDGARFECAVAADCPDGARCVAGICGGPDDGGAGGGSGGGTAGAGGGATAGGSGGGGGTGGGSAAGGAGGGAGTGGGVAGDGGCEFMPDPVDDQGLDTNCDGIDGVADGGLFVDPKNGSDVSNGGGRTNPLGTLTFALGLVRGSRPDTHSIFLAEGDYLEGVVWDRPVSLYGGYTSSWARDGGHAVVSNPDGGTCLYALGPMTSSTRLDSIDLRAVDATGPSAPSIAMRMEGASPSLRHMRVSAARGADGVGGSIPLPASIGSNGANGDAGLVGGLVATFPRPAVVGACGSGRPGGAGGAGLNTPATPGQVAGGGGGDAGAPGGLMCGPLCACAGSAGTGDGLTGAAGTDGMSGTDGPGGDGLGSLAGADWRPRNGVSGGAGQNGLPGHGGGGGGYLQVISDDGAGTMTFQHVTGSAGGGGATGGCGGPGGPGGTSGGASIGLLLALGSTPTLTDVAVIGGTGGNGAPGSAGGMGGGGGLGGLGGGRVYAQCTGQGLLSPTTMATIFYGGAGGNGGRGGNGGPGGRGGGGGGGPAIGVWCGQDAGFVGIAPAVLTGSLRPGTLGAPNGVDGVMAQRYGCP